MRNLKTFQVISLLVFGALAVGGVIAFATFKNTNVGEITNRLTMWGTVDRQIVSTVVDALEKERGDFQMTYEQKSVATFEHDLLEALATGQGPDLVLISQEDLIADENKLLTIPYDAYSERTFRDQFVEGGEVFLSPDGVLAFPIVVDPLVMYWNRDIFANAGVVSPPSEWVEFRTLAPKLTKRNGSTIIAQATLPFGEYVNVTNAKAILSSLMLQAGTPIVSWLNGVRRAVLAENFNLSPRPADAALHFYIDFSDPRQPTYSWNRALPASRDFFSAGDLATYFGFASEVARIREKNPNLNFDVAPLPQTSGSTRSTTFGNMLAVAIIKNSPFTQDAYVAAQVLSGSTASALFSATMKLPPARRDLLKKKPGTATGDTFYDAALIARTWADPDPAQTGPIFQRMIESSTSGRLQVDQAVLRADGELGGVLGD